jgi:hypothetical protein
MRGRPTKDPHTRPAINTLERLHMELGGKILENKQLHADLAEQMRHVEAVIKMLDPGYSLRAISVKRRKPNPWFKRGCGVCAIIPLGPTLTAIFNLSVCPATPSSGEYALSAASGGQFRMRLRFALASVASRR